MIQFRKISLALTIGLITSFIPMPNAYSEFSLEGNISEEKDEKRYLISKSDVPTGQDAQVNGKLGDFPVLEVFGAGAPGSGVIIAKKGNYYYAISANHVIGELLKGDELEVKTIDKVYHTAEVLVQDNEFDAALIRFNSNNKYYPALIDPNTTANNGIASIANGYALASKEAKSGYLRSSSGKVISVIPGNKDGYNILYSSPTNVGMSGGAIYTIRTKGRQAIHGMTQNLSTDKRYIKAKEDWDDSGISYTKYKGEFYCNSLWTPALIGIHGRAESYRAGGKSGASMGMPILPLLSKFQKTLLEHGIKSLPHELDTEMFKDACEIYKANY